jgi:hypothetical protein
MIKYPQKKDMSNVWDKVASLQADWSHHAEGLVNPKVHAQKRLLILDTPEHVDSENIKLKIGPRSLLDQLFSKRDF